MIATREGFGDEIVALGKENHDILVVDVDIGKSCKTGAFRKELPEQYLNVGIAEQNAAGVAAGLATCGKIPFVVTYAAFGSMRMCEMIRQEICYPQSEREDRLLPRRRHPRQRRRQPPEPSRTWASCAPSPT